MNPFRNTKPVTVTATSTVDKTTESHSNKQVTYAKLLQQFPKIKFSYELKSYKKVSNSSNEHECDDNNVYFMIPKGKKYFVWFKNGECLFLELDNDKQVVNVMSKKTSRIFPNDTILYGTHFYYRAPINVSSNSIIQYYFTIENIHYYNGVNVDATQTVFEKCKTLHLAFTTVSLEKTFQVDIGLPHIDTCLERISAVKPFYQVYCIQKKKSNDKTNQYQNVHLNAASRIQKNDVKQQPQQQTQEEFKTSVVTVSTHCVENGKKYVEKSNDYSNKNNNININNNNNNNNKKYKIFIVSADIQNDIYNLVDPDNLSDCTIANKLIASIPDYKTSVFMNALFRNIKENKSLDALEESDDEEEFENTNIDKFVDLTKKIKMKCIFNYKFKKWTPVECVN
jgi:hypothetical protein